jgi:hypothetical protein
MPPISYTDAEKELRVRFVTEYLFDYNSYLACLRLGFNAGFATDYAKKFMEESFVRQLIKQAEIDAENDNAGESNKRRIMAALFKEANYHGVGSSHAARVSALAKLTALYGMDAATKIESKVTTTNTQAVQFYLPENNR